PPLFHRPPPHATLSLHDALPIFRERLLRRHLGRVLEGLGVTELRVVPPVGEHESGCSAGRLLDGDVVEHLRPLLEVLLADEPHTDRKSTRLNSSHGSISYAVLCL